jgi:hypothetical protein
MAGNKSGAASGAATGATVGSAFGPVGTVVGGVIGGVAGYLSKNKKKTVELDPYAGMTPEQKASMATLFNYGQTGATPSGYQAGEAYDMSGFNYGLSPYEQAGMASLFDLRGANAPGLTTARNTLTGLANTEFNPEDQSTGLGSFRKALQRETNAASDVMNREAAITGSRFGTGIQRQKTDLAAQQSEQMGAKLAELFNNQQNRALSAAQGLTGLESTAAGMEQARLAQLFGYGSLERNLQNQQAQQAYADRQRQRDEQLATLGALQTVLSKGTNPGIMKYEYTQPSAFQQFTDSYNSSGGGGGMGSIMSLFNRSGSTGSAGSGMGSTGVSSPSSLGYTSYTGMR